MKYLILPLLLLSATSLADERYIMMPSVMVYDTKYQEYRFCLSADNDFHNSKCYFVPKRVYRLGMEECYVDIRENDAACGKELEELSY